MKNNFYKIRTEKRLNISEIAKCIGVSRQLLWGYEKEKNNLSKSVLQKVANFLDVKIEDLQGGDKSDFVIIKKYDIEASAGDGMLPIEEYGAAEIRFAKGFLGGITLTRPDHLNFIKVRGNSMYPTFKDGDHILVDKNKIDLETGGIFVIRMNGLLKVKRVIPDLFSGKIKIISDNIDKQDFPDYEVSIDEVYEKITIVGKVVWSGGKLP